MNAVQKLTELKVSSEEVSQEDARQLMDYLEQCIRKLSNLSEDYQEVYKGFQKLYNTIKRESGST